MSFRAKCRITKVESSLHPKQNGQVTDHRKVTLQPVYGEGEEDSNAQWSRWTPSGQVELVITNPEVWPDLVIGRAFYVDFTPTEG